MEFAPLPVIERSAAGSPAGPSAAHVALVADLLRSISTALRNYRLYGGQPAMLDRFVATVRKHLLDTWDALPLVRLVIDDTGIRWEEEVVYAAGSDPGDLAFLFFKDGIRGLTLLPGLEHEIEILLGVLARAPQLRSEEDDLVTLLWQVDLAKLRYEHVELSAEGADLPVADPGAVREISAAGVREDATARRTELSPEDFRDTLYFLDDADLRRLGDEVRREAERDLWLDVSSALFDRLEDGSPERQRRILHILRELLSHSLGAAQFDRAARFLGELARLAARPGVFSPDVLREVRGFYQQLADEATIHQLAIMLDESPPALRTESFAELLAYFPPTALSPLMRAASALSRPDVRRAFEQVIERLATSHREEVVRMLAHEDPGVAEEAVRWVARLRIGAASTDLVQMLSRSETRIRLAAILALKELGAATAGRKLMELLEDPDREIRIAAAKALSALEFVAACPVLEAAISSKRLRAADTTEKIAFFEAYGRLAGGEGIALLDRMLNGRSWLGRWEDPELRACAALGLGRVRHPSAHKALSTASSDVDPVVRSAVARALRKDVG